MSDSNRTGQGESASRLERSLGFWDNLFFGIGSILGAGIYAIIGEAAGLSGSMLWLSLLIAAVTALLTSGCYAELVSLFPDSGGGYEYIAQGLGRKFANLMSVILFLTGIISPAAIALAFGQYLGRLVDVDVFWAATGVIVAMASINCIGARNSSWFNIGATVVTLLGLVMVVACAAPSIGERSLTELHPENGVAGLFSGAALAFFSYVGFEDVVKFAEETRKPRLNTPWALVVSGLIVLVVYAVVAVSAVSVVAPSELAGSDGPLAEVMQNAWGPMGVTVISIVALFATSKCILSNIMSNSRLVYDLSRDTALPRFFGYLLPGPKTPVVAIGIIAALTWLFSLIGDLGKVASISNLCVLTLFLVVDVSLVAVRRLQPDQQAKFRLPFNVWNVSIINLAAIAMLLVMIGFNIFNLVT